MLWSVLIWICMVFSFYDCDLLIRHRWHPDPLSFCRVSSHPYRIGNLNSSGSLQVRLFSTFASVDPLSDWFRHTRPSRQRLLLLRITVIPLPVPDFRQVFAVLVDVMLVLDQLVFHLLLQVGALESQIRYAVDHVMHQVEPVQVVLHPHVKGRRDGALFLVATDVQVAVGTGVGEAVDQPG